MTFQIGEKVVYPSQGIGTIETISTRCFGSHLERFYLLRLHFGGAMTIMVPFSQAQEIGLRKVTTNGELMKVLDFLASGACHCNQDWKERFKENSEKMRGSALLEIAQVLKGLLLLKREKPLSFREKKMLDQARRLLVAELSISRGLSEEEAVALIGKALAQARLSLPEPL